MFWKKKPKKTLKSRDNVVQEAQQTMQNKREEIGSEALDKIKHAIMNKENSALNGAKKTIINADQDKVRDNLNLWLRE